MRSASLSSGLSARSGSLCEITRPRFVSMTSVLWQHGHVTSSSDFSFAIGLLLLGQISEHAVETVEFELLLHLERFPVGELRRQPQIAHLLFVEVEVLAEAGDEEIERRLHPAAGRNVAELHPV